MNQWDNNKNKQKINRHLLKTAKLVKDVVKDVYYCILSRKFLTNCSNKDSL